MSTDRARASLYYWSGQDPGPGRSTPVDSPSTLGLAASSQECMPISPLWGTV